MILRYDETCKGAILTASSNLLNYPVENVLETRISTLYRSNLNTIISIVFDCEEAVKASSICIANHNISSTPNVLRLEGNSSDFWVSPAFSLDLTWDQDIIIEDFTEQEYQYWRLVIEDLTNANGYIEMGRVWIGKYFITPGIGIEVPHDRLSRSVKSITIAGNTFGDRRDPQQKTVIRFPKLDPDQKDNIEYWFEVSDTILPFFITFDKAGNTMGSLYATINQNLLRFTRLGNTIYYSTVVEIIEEI